MKIVKTIIMPSITAAFAMAVIFGGFATSVSAQQLTVPVDQDNQSQPEEQPAADQNKPEESNDQQQDDNNDEDNSNGNKTQPYSYVAQPGDSYSLMARKAVQTYGINNEVDLNKAQIIFAETNITQAAGSPKLVVGQTVKLNEDSVKDWVNKAKDLSQEKQTAWEAYTQGVNFNTNNVGQAS